MGGSHCITNSLKQMFSFYEYQISEEMLFGLGSGLGFIYLNLHNSPFISCRIKPFVFEENIGELLNIEIKVKSSSKKEVALNKLLKNLDVGTPVMIYGDMVYLPYLNLGTENHFGGHSIVVCGYDIDKKIFYVSDRDAQERAIHTPQGAVAEDYHEITFDDLMKARDSKYRPFPPKNKWIDFDFSEVLEINDVIIKKAILKNSSDILDAPAHLLGINGIRKFSREILKWNKFPSDKLKISGITNYFMIDEKGGTGGGAFRTMYGNFLIEASHFVGDLKNKGNEYLEIGQLWDELASMMMNLYEEADYSMLKKMSILIENIAEKEFSAMSELVKIST